MPSSASHTHLDWLHFEKKGCDNLSKYSGSWFYKLGSALSAWPIYLHTAQIFSGLSHKMIQKPLIEKFTRAIRVLISLGDY